MSQMLFLFFFREENKCSHPRSHREEGGGLGEKIRSSDWFSNAISANPMSPVLKFLHWEGPCLHFIYNHTHTHTHTHTIKYFLKVTLEE